MPDAGAEHDLSADEDVVHEMVRGTPARTMAPTDGLVNANEGAMTVRENGDVRLTRAVDVEAAARAEKTTE